MFVPSISNRHHSSTIGVPRVFEDPADPDLTPGLAPAGRVPLVVEPPGDSGLAEPLSPELGHPAGDVAVGLLGVLSIRLARGSCPILALLPIPDCPENG
jgi:hypothetical protein